MDIFTNPFFTCQEDNGAASDTCVDQWPEECPITPKQEPEPEPGSNLKRTLNIQNTQHKVHGPHTSYFFNSQWSPLSLHFVPF